MRGREYTIRGTTPEVSLFLLTTDGSKADPRPGFLHVGEWICVNISRRHAAELLRGARADRRDIRRQVWGEVRREA